MSVPLIKIEKKTNGKIEQAKTIISIFCELSNIHLSQSELMTVAYFMVYGATESTKELILKSKVLSTIDSLSNTMSKLRKVGLLKKMNKRDILNEQLQLSLEPLIGIFIKIDNR